MVYIQTWVTVLYFSIIIVFWLLYLCEAGGDASLAPQANLVCSVPLVCLNKMFYPAF